MITFPEVRLGQRALCDRIGADFVPSPVSSKVGISQNFDLFNEPINGLRHLPVGDTTGWYIWSGEELSSAAHFFQPIHVSHLIEASSPVVRFLGLPPGWRFLFDAAGYEDIWFDESLLLV